MEVIHICYIKKLIVISSIFFVSLALHTLFIANSQFEDKKIGFESVDKNLVFAWDFHEVIVTKAKLQMLKKMISIISHSQHKWSLITMLFNPWFWAEISRLRKKHEVTDKVFFNIKQKYPVFSEVESDFYDLLNLYVPNYEVLAIIDQLSDEGYRHYLASNISERSLTNMQHKYPEIFARFSGIYAVEPKNGEIGAEKPKPHIVYYEGLRNYITRQGHSEHAHIVFIDDLPKNIDGAQKSSAHIDAILFKNATDLKHQLEQRHIFIKLIPVPQPA